MITPPLCPTCRHNLPDQVRIAGKVADDHRACWHRIVSFPKATSCALYEREPGVD